jgi:ribosomal protein S10
MSSKMLNEAFVWAEPEEEYDTPVEDYDASVISTVIWESDDEKYERQLLAMLDDAYDGWVSYEETWPKKRIIYPSVKFMVDHHAPFPKRPKALDTRIAQEMMDFKELKDLLWKKQKDATKAYEKAQLDLETEVKKPKAYAQKWSERINGAESDAVKHLKIELEKATKTYTKAKEEFENHEKAHKILLDLVQAHKMSVEAYEECMVLEKKMTKDMWAM